MYNYVAAGMMDSSGGGKFKFKIILNTNYLDGVSAVNRKRRHFQSYEQDF